MTRAAGMPACGRVRHADRTAKLEIGRSRPERFIAPTSFRAFSLLGITTVVSCRLMDEGANQLLVGAESEE
jgi:hypothetical protein